MTKEQGAALALIRAGLKGEPCGLPDGLDWNLVHRIVRDQGMISAAYHAIRISKPAIPADFLRYFQAEALAAIRSDYVQASEIAALFGELEKAGADYLPLKGIEFKPMYPRPEYRWMADADVFIRRSQYPAIAGILEERGYAFVSESGHELTWDKPGALHLELHYAIADPEYGKYAARYGDAFSLAERVGETRRYRFGATDHLIYSMAHFAKHYMLDGANLRNLADVYYLSRRDDLDRERLLSVLDELQLRKLYEAVLDALGFWMEGRDFSGTGRLLMGRILAGSEEFSRMREFALRVARQNEGRTEMTAGAKLRALLYSAFPPLKIMRQTYPCLRKAPVLLPVFWIVRIAGTLFFRRDAVRRLADAHRDAPEQVGRFVEEMEALGLRDWIDRKAEP